MAAPYHVPFRSGSLSSSLDEEKKRPTHLVREVDYSEKRLPDIPHKQPQCYKPFATRTPFLLAIVLAALAVLITVETFAHKYRSFGPVQNLSVPRIPGLSAEQFDEIVYGGDMSLARRDTPHSFNNVQKRSLSGEEQASGLDKRDNSFVPNLGVLGIVRDMPTALENSRRMLRAYNFFNADSFRTSQYKRRDAESIEGMVVEIDIMPDVTEQQEISGGCGGSLVDGRRVTCSRVVNPNLFFRHDRLAKRQDENATASDTEESADSSNTAGAPADASRSNEPSAGQSDPSDASGPSGNGSSFSVDDIFEFDFGPFMITRSQYFIASYLLIILAFFIRVLWICAYNSIRLMEPFYALANPKGATAEHALTCMYLHDSLLPEPIRAFRGRQWLLFMAGITSVLVALLPAFSLGVLKLDDTHCVKADVPDPRHPCAQTVFYANPILRLFETILILIMVTVGGFAVANLYRTSGVYSDPSAIATLTSLLHHPTMIERLRRIDDSTTDDEIDDIFEDDRYRIAGYRTFDMTTRYGIVPVGKTGWVSRSATQDSITSLDKSKARAAARQLMPRRRRSKWHTTIRKLATEISMGIMLVGLLAFLVAYYTDVNPNNKFNLFMNSVDNNMTPRGWPFWPRFILTAAGTFVASAWRRIECQNRTQAPYQRLRKPGPATPLLTPTTSSAWTSFPFAVIRRQPFVALAATNAILAEFLLIALSGVPFNPVQLETYYLNHQYISMAFVSFMILSLAIHLWNRLWRQSFMPREPDTIIGALSYVAASDMLEDFEYLALHDTDTRARRVQSWGKQYQFAEQICVDGVQRLALDEATRQGPDGHA